MRKKRILMVAPVAYSALYQRHQAFADLLKNRCDYDLLYLNPIQSPGWGLEVKAETSRPAIVSAKLPFRAAKWPFIQQYVAMMIYRLIKKKFKTDNETILWIAEPSLAALARFAWASIIYDRCDLHGAFPGQNSQVWHRYESELFAKADLVVVSHKKLLDDIPAASREKAILAKNACADSFASDKAEKKAGCDRLNVISAGAHYEWIDCRWLKMIASCPGIRLHIAGTGRGKDFQQLIALPQVEYHGSLDQQSLGSLYQRCQVGLAPFADIPLVSAVDPIKVYEYAAAGLEVWATPIAALRDNHLIDRFVVDAQQVRSALAGFNPTRPLKQVPRWSERLQTILDSLAGLGSN